MSESRTRLGDILISIVFPPFRGTAVAVWIYFVVCFLMNPHSIILNGNFPDPDDYMYLAQAIDLVKGQGWYDFIQHRLNPPDGTYIHFLASFMRLLCRADYAFVALVQRGAVATVEAAFLPLAFLVLFLGVLKKAARPLAGDDWAGVTAFIALFAGYTIYLFAPGQVDHHGLEALLAIAVFGCLIRPQMKWAALAGFLTAAGPVVGLDFAPVLVLFALWIGIRGVIAGGAAADAAAFFGLALFLSSAGFLLIDRPPPLWLVHDRWSIGSIGCGAGCRHRDLFSWRRSGIPRETSGMALYCRRAACPCGGSAFLIAFPEMWHKSFGAVGTELTQRLFDNTDENRPALARYGWSVRFLTLMLWCATVSVSVCGRSCAARVRYAGYGLLVFLLIVTTSVGLFYQYRFMYYAQAFNILALAPLLRDGWAWLPRRYQGCPLCAAQLGLILLIGPLPELLLPALTDGLAV